MSNAIHHAICTALKTGAPGLSEPVRTAIATAIGINLRAISEPGIRRDDMQKLTTATAADDDNAYALDWLRHQIEIVDDQIAKVGGDNPAKTLLAMIEPGTPAARWREKGEADPHGHTDHYKGDRARLAHGNMTDDELANAVYLDPHIGHLTAAKERIRWLSRKLIEVQQGAALRSHPPTDPHAKDAADWCQRSLDAARATGDIDTRPFVQNAERIIRALRLLAAHPQAPASGEVDRRKDAEEALAEFDPDRRSIYWAKYLPVQPALSSGECKHCGGRRVYESTDVKTHERVEVECLWCADAPASSGESPRRWRHLKRGTTYTEIGRGGMQATGNELDMESVVIYRADKDGSLWVRPVAEFEDGRFEKVA